MPLKPGILMLHNSKLSLNLPSAYIHMLLRFSSLSLLMRLPSQHQEVCQQFEMNIGKVECSRELTRAEEGVSNIVLH